jgi:hypothetical protein
MLFFLKILDFFFAIHKCWTTVFDICLADIFYKNLKSTGRSGFSLEFLYVLNLQKQNKKA